MKIFEPFICQAEDLAFFWLGYYKLMYQEIKDLNIRFNLYDLERKIFILKEKELDEVKSELPKLNISRLDTIADSKIIVPDYDYNDIWRNI